MSVACGRIYQCHERFSDDPQGQMIFKCLAAGEALNVIVQLSKSLPVEVNNSTIEFNLPVDSHYSSPDEALHLIVESKGK